MQEPIKNEFPKENEIKSEIFSWIDFILNNQRKLHKL